MVRARTVVSCRLDSRSTSRRPQAIDVLTRLEIVAEAAGMTGRGARRLYGLRRLVSMRAEITVACRRSRDGL
jgi:hypothetical protein